MGLNIIFTYDVLNEERNDIDNEKLEEHTNGITSKTELRKRFASMSYDIMYEKDIEKETKLDLIRKLNQALEDKINQIEIDPVEEQETAEDLHGKIEHFITIELNDTPNQKGNYLKNIYTNVKSLNYPISFTDQVNNYLTDIATQNKLFFTNDVQEKQEIRDSMDKNKIEHQISKIIPNKQPIGGTKNKKTKRRNSKKNKSKKLRK